MTGSEQPDREFRFQSWLPLEIQVIQVPDSPDIAPQEYIADLRGEAKKGILTVDLTIELGTRESQYYRVVYRGEWGFSGEDPDESELGTFVTDQAYPRLLAVVNAELATLSSRIGRPRPAIPEFPLHQRQAAE